MYLLIREGFRSRLETIVRGQVSSQSENSSNNNNTDFRSDETHANTPQEIEHENQEQTQTQSLGHDTDGHQAPSFESGAAVQSTNQQTIISEGEDWQNQGVTNEWRERTSEVVDRNWQEISGNDWVQETLGNEVGTRVQATNDILHQRGSREPVESWSEGPSDPPRLRRTVPVRRANRFHALEDDNVYSMELRELLSR